MVSFCHGYTGKVSLSPFSGIDSYILGVFWVADEVKQEVFISCHNYATRLAQPGPTIKNGGLRFLIKGGKGRRY